MGEPREINLSKGPINNFHFKITSRPLTTTQIEERERTRTSINPENNETIVHLLNNDKENPDGSRAQPNDEVHYPVVKLDELLTSKSSLSSTDSLSLLDEIDTNLPTIEKVPKQTGKADEEEEQHRVYTWIAPLDEGADFTDEDSYTDTYTYEDYAPINYTDYSNTDSKEVPGNKRNVPAPELVMAGSSFEAPVYQGKLDPKSFSLHAVEIHQYVTTTTIVGDPDETPKFIREGIDLNKQSVDGSNAIPWDPNNSGMLVPTIFPKNSLSQPAYGHSTTLGALAKDMFSKAMPHNVDIVTARKY